MKMKSILLTLVVLVSAMSAFANDGGKSGFAVVHVQNSDIFKVIYKAETAGKVKLNIISENGAVLVSETINASNGFIVPVNFAGLAYGDYTVEIVDAAGKRSEKVSYLPKKATKVVHVCAMQNSKVLVSVANPANDQVTVRFFDANNNLLFTSSRISAEDFAQVFNVASVKNFTMEIADSTGVIKTVKF